MELANRGPILSCVFLEDGPERQASANLVLDHFRVACAVFMERTLPEGLAWRKIPKVSGRRFPSEVGKAGTGALIIHAVACFASPLTKLRGYASTCLPSRRFV